MDRVFLATLSKTTGRRGIALQKLARDAGCATKNLSSTVTAAEAAAVERLAQSQDARATRATKPRQVIDLATPPPTVRQPSTPDLKAPPNACTCCGIRMEVASRAARSVESAVCGYCAPHARLLGQDDARLLQRLTDHDRRLRSQYSEVWWSRDETDQELALSKEKVRAALRSRDAWKETLVRVVVAHEETEKGCKCGASRYPCSTILAVQRTNQGIWKQIESDFLTLTDEELEDRFAPRDDDY